MKDGGYFGFIIPNTILTNNYFRNLRSKILNECQIKALIEFGYYVFQDAKIDSLIIILKKEGNKKSRDSNEVSYAKIEKPTGSMLSIGSERRILQSEFLTGGHNELNVGKNNQSLLSKIDRRNDCVRLGSLVNINLGFRVKNNQALIHSVKQNGDVPILHGRDISRYNVNFQNRYFAYRKDDIVGGCSKREVYEADEKLLIQAIRNIKLKRRIVAAYDNSRFFVVGGLLSVTKKHPDVNLKYVLALLNSKLLNFYFKSISIDKNIKVVFLTQLPIISKSKEEEDIVKQVNALLLFNKRLNELSGKKTDEHAVIEHSVEKTEAEIDDLVYKIYGITEDDKQIIEDALK